MNGGSPPRPIYSLASLQSGFHFTLTFASPQKLIVATPAGIRVIDIATGATKLVLPHAKLGVSYLYAVSPDGKRVAGGAFFGKNDREEDFVVSIDGTQRWRIPESVGTVPHAKLEADPQSIYIYLR
jgi:hypothetical protein